MSSIRALVLVLVSCESHTDLYLNHGQLYLIEWLRVWEIGGRLGPVD